jgi:hypothetical protein
LGQELSAHILIIRHRTTYNNLIERNRFGVLNVLLLLTVSWGLLERLDNEGGCGWNNRDSGLTVLDGELYGHTEAFLN